MRAVMRRRTCRVAAEVSAVALMGSVVLPPVSRAQDLQPSPPTFRAQVNLVEVVAVVTDADGRSLDDLVASDFHVLEDGTPRTLVSMRRLAPEPRPAAREAADPLPADANVERLSTSATSADAPAFVLLLDDLDTSPRDAHRVIRAAERALETIPDSALVAVLTTSGVGGSLLTLEPRGPEHLEQVRAFRGRLLLRATTSRGITPLQSIPGGSGMAGPASLDQLDPARSVRRANALTAVAEILGRAGSRRRVLLWVAQTMGVSPVNPYESHAAQRRALDAALNHDVTVYVLDPRENHGGWEDSDSKRTGGTLGTGDSAMEMGVDDMAAVPLTQLTRETGGRYITMANDLGGFMGRIIEQNSTAYLLVYESQVSTEAGRHRIDVRVTRPGARVSARRGYVVHAPDADDEASVRPPPMNLLTRTLMGSAPQGQLRLTVQAVPRFANGKHGSVAVTVLAEDVDGRLSSPVEVALATFDGDGRLTNSHQLRLEPPPEGQPQEFTTEIPLARGHHQLRVAAVTMDATRHGLAIVPVEVIEPARKLVMAPPVVLQRVGEHVAPTAVRRFVTGTSLGVQAEVAGRAVRQNQVAIRMSLTDRTGAVVRTAVAAVDPGESPDRQRATGLLDTSGLTSGPYLVSVEAIHRGSGETVHRVVPIHLHAPTGSAAVTRHSIVAHGLSSPDIASGTFVIRTEMAWREFWEHLPTRQPVPPIDFDRVTLLAIVAASEGTGTPVVVSVSESGDEMLVRWQTQPVGSPARMKPFTVVAWPRAFDGPVRFVGSTGR